MKDFDFLIADRIGIKGNWWFHRNQRKQLQHMILHHIADSPRLFIIAGTALYTDIFRHGDLHTVDIATVPNWLEDTISQAEDEDILHCLLTQIMVDTIDLLFLENFPNLTV